MRDGHFFALAFLVATLDHLDISSILDIGSGTGRAIQFIKERRPDIRIVGIEPVDEIVNNGFKNVDIVKLDIEGFEYEVLESLLSSSVYVGQILVEFHDFLPQIGFEQTKSIKRLLKDCGYVCFYKKRYDHSYIHTDLC